MYTVYCHVFPNGKRYVGITKCSTSKRFGLHGGRYKTCPLVARAIEKYGWAKVTHEVLDVAECKDEAENKERYYIALFNTTDPRFGYNVLPGGDVSNNAATPEMRYKLGNGQRGRSRTQEEKEKIGQGVKETFKRPESNGHFGLKHTEEARKKMSESQKRRWENDQRLRENASARMQQRLQDAEYRKHLCDRLAQYRRKAGEWHMPEEAKAKIGQHFKGVWIGEKSPCSKPVLQYDMDGNLVRRWANAGEAERAGVALRNNISKCCRHAPHCHTAGGFKWEYEKAE